MNEELASPSSAIGRYRFIAWVMPALIFPVLAVLGICHAGSAWMVAAIVVEVPVLIAFGQLDGRLFCRQYGISLESREAGLGWRLATYLLWQIAVIVPVVTFALLYAFLAWAFYGFLHGY
ncbi:MAG TPA: hypothetical protein VGE67_12280 [Haloferula sp.]